MTTLRIRAVTTLRILLLARIRLIRLRAEVVDRQVMIMVESLLQLQSSPRSRLHLRLSVGSNLFVETAFENLERSVMPTENVEIAIRKNTVSTANASRTLQRPQLHPLLALGSNLFVEMVLLNLQRNAMQTAKVAIVMTTNTATTANASRSLHRPRQRSQPKDMSIRLHQRLCAAIESGTRMLVKPATRQRILLVATFMSIVMIRVAAIPRVEMVGRTKMKIVTCRLSRSLTRPANLVIRANQTARARKPRHNRLQESQPKQGTTPLLLPR
jgi:hypothetical protein